MTVNDAWDTPEQAPSRAQLSSDSSAAPRRSWWRRALTSWVAVIVVAVLGTLFLKSFLFPTYYIPSASMEPTLRVGDHIAVSRLSVIVGTIHRGDILVFDRPSSENCGGVQVSYLVKRVIGLPNEYLKSIGSIIYYSDSKDPQHLVWHRIDETWPHTEPLGYGIPGDTHVPPGHYYMLGDNHGLSCDSRWWGPIARSSVIGKVFLRFWPPSRFAFL